MVVRHILFFLIAIASAFHIGPKPFFLDVNSTASPNNGSLRQDVERKEKQQSEKASDKDGVTWWDVLAILVILVFIVLYAMVSCYMDMSMNDIDFSSDKNSPRSDVVYSLLPDLKTT